MNKVKIINFCDLLIEGVIALLLFLLPLYFSFFYRSLDGFLLNPALERTMIFQIGVCLILGLTLFKAIFTKSITLWADKKYFLILTPFFLVLCLATWLSIDPHTSFWGSYPRQQGLITHFFYLLFFYLLLINLKSRARLERLINFILAASLPIVIFGVLEWLGINVLFRSAQFSFGGRVSSTIGQPVFLGNYLLLVIFLSVYRLIYTKKFFFRLGFGLLLALQLICFVFTYSRGSWLGLFFGLASVSLVAVYLKNKKIFFMITAAGVIAVGLLFFLSITKADFFKPPNEVKEVRLSYRLKSVLSFQSGSTAMRVKYWRAAIDAIKQRPIFGYGPETQRLSLFRYYDPSWMVYEEINSFTDRAHNEYLEILLTSGLIGLAAYLLIVSAASRKTLIYLKDNSRENRAPVFFIAIGLTCYQFGLLFSFSTTETMVYALFFLAATFIMVNDFKEERLLDLAVFKKLYFFTFVYGVLIVIFLLAIFIMNGIQRLEADNVFQSAKKDFKEKKYVSMMQKYDLATKLDRSEEYYRSAFIIDLVNSGAISVLENSSSTDIVDFLEKLINRDVGLNDNYFRLIRRAIVMSVYGKYRDNRYFTEAEKLYDQMIGFNPAVLDGYRNMALMYAYRGQPQKAIETYGRIFKYLPDLTNSDLNDEHRSKIYKYLAEIYEGQANSYCQLKDYRKCEQNFLNSLQLNPGQARTYKALADLYRFQSNFKRALLFYNDYARLVPGDYEAQKLIDALNKTNEAK